MLEGAQGAICDLPPARDVIAVTAIGVGCHRLAIEKGALAGSFFDLRTELMGEVLEKFVKYRVQVTIWGDHSGDAGKALRDFMRERNRGRAAFFADSREGAPVQTGTACLGEIERPSLPKQKSHPDGWLFCDWEGPSGRRPFSLVLGICSAAPQTGSVCLAVSALPKRCVGICSANRPLLVRWF